MRLRRYVALLTSLAMLHLSVKPGDAACGAPSKDGHHAALPSAGHVAPVADGHSRHTMGAPTHIPTGGSVAHVGVPPCEVPAQQHCCNAFAGCSAGAGLTSAGQGVHPSTAVAARVLDASRDAPATRTSSPEPPPPKA